MELLKAMQVRRGLWQLGCFKVCTYVGVPSLSWPLGWDTLPGVGGWCCPPGDVDTGGGCCPLQSSDIGWARKRQFSGWWVVAPE